MYENKEIAVAEYFKLVRYPIARLVPKGINKILEVGCANGATLHYLKTVGKACEIVGVDILNKLDYKLDKFIQGDIEKIILPYKNNYFDVIILGDVLEHLVDPWTTMTKLNKLINSEGLVISSLPNVREIKTLTNILLNGDFKYHEHGILDKTHLRFFCKKNMITLFEESGLFIQTIKPSLPGKRYFANKITFKLFEELLATQYIILATKS